MSTSRIAAGCSISKGHLHYHFPTKREIIVALFTRMSNEINTSWQNDHLTPTMDHLARMFVRQLTIISRYNFFYRDLGNLLQDDSLLRSRFNQVRVRRMADVKRFLRALEGQGALRPFESETELDLLLTSTWVLSDYWLEHVASTGKPIDESCFRAGYDTLINMIRPYLTEQGRESLAQVRIHAILSGTGQNGLGQV